MHDPFSTFRISCDWNCHVSRTPPSSGGTDYAIPVGTPIRAAFDGVLTNRPPVQYPASGNVAILDRGDGLEFYHLHLSRFVTHGRVAEGDIIAYSGGAYGAPGSGSSTGPHVHVNAYYHGVIHDIHDFFTTTASSVSTPITPIQTAAPTTEENTTMKPIIAVCTDGPSAGVFAIISANGFKLVQPGRPEPESMARKIVAAAWSPATPPADVRLTGAEWVYAPAQF
jgi:murein DD-endopeptidase MepM/ murein hydrolase activator NlpD